MEFHWNTDRFRTKSGNSICNPFWKTAKKLGVYLNDLNWGLDRSEPTCLRQSINATVSKNPNWTANACADPTGQLITVDNILSRSSSVEEYWQRYVLGQTGFTWDNFVSFFTLFDQKNWPETMHHSAGYPSIAIGWDAGSSVADCGSLSPQGCQILWESCLFHVTFSLRPSYSSGFQAWPPTNFSIIAKSSICLKG